MKPNIITSSPASVKRSPANKIMEGTCVVSTEKRLYPILTQGKALPQRIQHIMAPMHTTKGFVKKACALSGAVSCLFSKLFSLSVNCVISQYIIITALNFCKQKSRGGIPFRRGSISICQAY